MQLEAHGQTGHKFGNVAVEKRSAHLERVQHGAAVNLHEDVVEQEFTGVDVEGSLQRRRVRPVFEVAARGRKQFFILQEGGVRTAEELLLHFRREGRQHGLYAQPGRLRCGAEKIVRRKIEVDVAGRGGEPSADRLNDAFADEARQAAVALRYVEADVMLIAGPHFV